ncbi:hypothetical protein C8R45DRAFT_1077700 [Mycena sanguinolenta]|nr:hypothetical protein C8R45DRAFT_1077700 [Mycena sanguinolenta]
MSQKSRAAGKGIAGHLVTLVIHLLQVVPHPFERIVRAHATEVVRRSIEVPVVFVVCVVARIRCAVRIRAVTVVVVRIGVSRGIIRKTFPGNSVQFSLKIFFPKISPKSPVLHSGSFTKYLVRNSERLNVHIPLKHPAFNLILNAPASLTCCCHVTSVVFSFSLIFLPHLPAFTFANNHCTTATYLNTTSRSRQISQTSSFGRVLSRFLKPRQASSKLRQASSNLFELSFLNAKQSCPEPREPQLIHLIAALCSCYGYDQPPVLTARASRHRRRDVLIHHGYWNLTCVDDYRSHSRHPRSHPRRVGECQNLSHVSMVIASTPAIIDVIHDGWWSAKIFLKENRPTLPQLGRNFVHKFNKLLQLSWGVTYFDTFLYSPGTLGILKYFEEECMLSLSSSEREDEVEDLDELEELRQSEPSRSDQLSPVVVVSEVRELESELMEEPAVDIDAIVIDTASIEVSMAPAASNDTPA